jgi:hypothetical protein
MRPGLGRTGLVGLKWRSNKAEQQIIPTHLPAFRMYLIVFLVYLKNMYRSWLGTFRFSYTLDSGTKSEFNQVLIHQASSARGGGGIPEKSEASPVLQ